MKIQIVRDGDGTVELMFDDATLDSSPDDWMQFLLDARHMIDAEIARAEPNLTSEDGWQGSDSPTR